MSRSNDEQHRTARRDDAPATAKERASVGRGKGVVDGGRRSGTSLAELASAFRYCGLPVSSTTLRRMFDEADVDGSGAIEYDEFEQLAKRMLTSRC